MTTRTLLAATTFLIAVTAVGCKNRAAAVVEPRGEDRYGYDENHDDEVTVDDDFVTWDVDNDGYLSENEFDDGVFDDWDANDDGVIDDDEYIGADFDTWDVDGDGVIDDDEFDDLYGSWDTDDDGVLARDEFRR